MVKTYLRFELKAAHGVVTSPECNAIYDSKRTLAVCGCLEFVKVWSLRQGSCISTLFDGEGDDPRPAVMCLTRAPEGRPLVAAGYRDGSVRLWNLESGESEVGVPLCQVCFHGHRSAVVSLAFNHDGSLLASGSMDTEVYS
eukprot:974261-Amorphochlora_amoeboformis.AAC.1